MTTISLEKIITVILLRDGLPPTPLPAFTHEDAALLLARDYHRKMYEDYCKHPMARRALCEENAWNEGMVYGFAENAKTGETVEFTGRIGLLRTVLDTRTVEELMTEVNRLQESQSSASAAATSEPIA